MPAVEEYGVEPIPSELRTVGWRELFAINFTSDDPRFAVGRVFDSPDQRFTWVGFATWITVTCGASLTLVTNVADLCRYTPTRRDMRIGLAASAVLSVAVTTFVGGYAAAATGETNPFVAVTELTHQEAPLVLLLAAIVVQTIAANITNVYLVLKRMRIDVAALFDPGGPYRYVNGVNAAAILAVAAGVGAYYALPHELLKVVWGVGVGALAYLVLSRAQEALESIRATAAPSASSERSGAASQH